MSYIKVKGKQSCSAFWFFCMDNNWTEPEASPFWKNAADELKTQYKEEAKAVKKRGVWPYIRPKMPYMDGSRSSSWLFYIFLFFPLCCCFFQCFISFLLSTLSIRETKEGLQDGADMGRNGECSSRGNDIGRLQ